MRIKDYVNRKKCIGGPQKMIPNYTYLYVLELYVIEKKIKPI